MGDNRIRNWDRTQSWRPEAVHRPRDEAQIAEILRSAADKKQRTKPVGGALSWSDIIDMPGHALRFDRMDQVLEVDRDKGLARVQAGARLSHVNEVLAEHGVALDNFGSIIEQTAAGYIGSGSHGTGGKTTILSHQIESLRLVDGTGEIHQLDATSEPELFRHARVHLGCLGALTEITFRCGEPFDLEEKLELCEFDQVLADLDNYIDNNDYLKLWWLPYTKKVQVYQFNRTDTPRTGFSFAGFMDGRGISGAAFSGLMGLSRLLPFVTPAMLNLIQAIHFSDHRRVDRSDRVIKYAGTIPLHQETEYAIDRQHAAEAIDKTRRLVLGADYRVNFPLEVRFVAADDIPMSPTHGRDSCYIGAYVGSVEWAKRYHADFEELISDYDGRPHWGKTFHRTPEQLRHLYGGYDEFNRLRQRLDPEGLFRNSFVDRVFETL